VISVTAVHLLLSRESMKNQQQTWKPLFSQALLRVVACTFPSTTHQRCLNWNAQQQFAWDAYGNLVARNTVCGLLLFQVGCRIPYAWGGDITEENTEIQAAVANSVMGDTPPALLSKDSLQVGVTSKQGLISAVIRGKAPGGMSVKTLSAFMGLTSSLGFLVQRRNIPSGSSKTGSGKKKGEARIRHPYLTGIVARGKAYLCNELFGKNEKGASRLNCDLLPTVNGEHARLFLVARRDIEAGEELGCYYGVDYCRSAYLTKCLCTECCNKHTCNGAPPPNTCTTCGDQMFAMYNASPNPYGTLKPLHQTVEET